MLDVPFTKAPFEHVLGIDKYDKFRATVELNLGCTFVATDIREIEPKNFFTFAKEKAGRLQPGGHIHINGCLCCKEASTAAGRPIPYESYACDIERIAGFVEACGRVSTVTYFGEFVVNHRIIGLFRRWFPQASIAILAGTILETRRRVYVANGFSIEALEELIEQKRTGNEKLRRILGRGYVKSNTGSSAKYQGTHGSVPTITCTGLVFVKSSNGAAVQVTKEQLLAIRSQGTDATMDLSMVTECLGREIVGQGVSLVVAEAVSELCAKAHTQRWD